MNTLKNIYFIFIYKSDNKKYISDFPKEKIDSRNLRDSGTQSDRIDARNCFYPIYVKDGAIIGFGDVSDNNYHPESSNIVRDDGVIEVYPLSESNQEKKWRYARDSVESIIKDLTVKKR